MKDHVIPSAARNLEPSSRNQSPPPPPPRTPAAPAPPVPLRNPHPPRRRGPTPPRGGPTPNTLAIRGIAYPPQVPTLRPMTSLTKRSWVLLAAALVFGMLATGAVSRCTTTSEIGRVLDPELEMARAYRGPQWTPDGTNVIFVPRNHLYTVNVTGEGLRRISRDGALNDAFEIDLAPNVSPNGGRIAYTTMRYRTGNLHSFEIVTSDLNGRDVQRLTDIEWLETNPVWSPDGTRIAFFSDRGDPEGHRGNFRLYVMNRDGSNVRSIAPATGVTLDPVVWSPNGEMLAFWGGQIESISDGRAVYACALYTVRADGSSLTNISGVPCLSNSSLGVYGVSGNVFLLPTWSPDSQRIAFVLWAEGQEGLFVATPEGSDVRKIADLPAASPLWLPVGSRIVYQKGDTLWAVSPDNPSRNWPVSSERVPASSYLSLSPNGNRIAAYHPIFGDAQKPWLQVISLDGTMTPVVLQQDLEALWASENLSR